MLKYNLTFLYFFSFGLVAQNDTISEKLYQHSVEEILALPVVQKDEETVTTASKKTESILEAPAVVSIVSAQEITAFGANNLREIIERVVGVLAMGSYLFPDNAVSMRGSLLSHYDNHILLLLNGRPMREGLTGGVNSSIYLTFPIASIARIEVIRGPGSVLYGSNAFAGVINIITENNAFNGLKINTNSFAGTFGTLGFQTNIRAKKNDLAVNVGGSFSKSEGWDFQMLDERKDSVNQTYGHYNLGGHIGINYKNLSISTFFSSTLQDNLGALPIKSLGAPNKKLKTSRAFLDVGYGFTVSKNWTSQLNLTYNSFSENYLVASSVFDAFSDDFIAELDNRYSLFGDKLSVLTGVVAYWHTGGGYEQGINNVPLYNQFWWSAYLQADWKIVNNLKLVAGVQANKPENIDLDIVPRLGMTYKFNQKIGAKILYAQAFRSAFALERSLFAPGILKGNPNLKPEKVNTLDFQIFRYSKSVQFSVNYFQSYLTDIITRVAVPNSPENSYDNLGKLQISGLEAETKIFFNPNFSLISSYGFSQNTLNDSIKNATHIPEHSFKVGLAYNNEIIDGGVFSSSFSDFGDVAVVRSSRAEVNPSALAFSYVTLNLSVDIFKLMPTNVEGSLLGFIYVSNLLNQKIYYPEFSRRRINTIPGRGGRNIQVGIRFMM